MPDPPRVVAIAGPSGSGKTTIADRLSGSLPGNATVVPLDAYYRDRSQLDAGPCGEANFDHPDALDAERMTEELARLARGETVEIPRYDFARHRRRLEGRVVTPGDWLIVEGILALYHERLRPLWHLSVFVALDDATCLERRIARDTNERGRTRESIIDQYNRTVRPMYRRFVEPTRRYADIVLNGTLQPDDAVRRILERLAR